MEWIWQELKNFSTISLKAGPWPIHVVTQYNCFNYGRKLGKKGFLTITTPP